MAMEQQVHAEGMDQGGELTPEDPLKPMSLNALETLVAALDPRLDGFGAGPSCLDDALAYLSRLASSADADEAQHGTSEAQVMREWIETWRAAGGNRQTLRLMVQTVMRERLGQTAAASTRQ